MERMKDTAIKIVLISLVFIHCKNDQSSEHELILSKIESKLGIPKGNNSSREIDIKTRLEIIDSMIEKTVLQQKRAFIAYKSLSIGVTDTFRANAVLASHCKELNPILILQYNETFDTISLNRNFELFEIMLNPYKLGLNEYKGRIIEGNDNYEFEGSFYVK